MKRWIALGIAVSPLWVAAVSPSSIDGRAIAARFFQCCTLTSDFPAASFTYNIEYVGTVGTQPERDAFAVRVGAAGARWNSEFEQRNENVAISFTATNPTLTVRVDVNYVGEPFWTQDDEIIVGPDWVTTLDVDQVTADFQHEFGHQLGFAQAAAGCSIMSDWDPQNPIIDFTACDLSSFEWHFGEYTFDDDSDTFFAPASSDEDCDDTNADIYPGAFDTNPYCGVTEIPWPGGLDYNCDGIDDSQQKVVICGETPILIDVGGGGFRLTDRAGGVRFDLDNDGRAEQIPWTERLGDDAWLVLDRNSNARIDDGGEMFGNYSPQPVGPDRNGFIALAVFDARSEGGNRDGWIDASDAIYPRLQLWRDVNHDGESHLRELTPLAAAGLVRLSLHYQEFLRVDEFGNWFRFGARIIDKRNRDVGPWAFDVFLDYPAGLTPPGPTRRLNRGR